MTKVKSMYEHHISTRKQIILVSVVIILLFLSGETSYKIPQIDITVKGEYLWPLLAFVHVFIVLKGHLIGAINGVMMPWSVPKEGPWGKKSVWQLPEYWVVFFSQAVPIATYLIGMICVFIQLYNIFITVPNA
ncbi:hypothetical protein ACUIA5_16815 [Vibrio cholerae]